MSNSLTCTRWPHGSCRRSPRLHRASGPEKLNPLLELRKHSHSASKKQREIRGVAAMKTSAAINRQRNVWKGLLASAVGGLVASFVMGQFHSAFAQNAKTSSRQGQEDSTVKAASAISRSIFH